MTLLKEPGTAAGTGTKAVLLLGHGSKAPEANETLRKVARTVKERGGYGAVVPAFLQMERPDFQEAVETMVADGYTDLTVMPYFLYMGLHVTKDLPAEIAAAKEKHPGLNITLTANLGYHDKLIDITVERIDAIDAPGPGLQPVGVLDTHPIEAESFRLITEELGEVDMDGPELDVLKRVIHTTADFEFADLLKTSPGAVAAGVEAVRGGRDIITDVNMVASGITPGRLAPFGSTVRCFASDRDVAAAAKSEGITRTAAAMRKAAPSLAGGIVAVGNAPTALVELLRLVKEEGVEPPALVVGTPVGFVGAAEAKDELMASGLDFIVTAGRKGGSTVAVAVVNAIAIQALNSTRPA
jgi:precorrin-8X/cobalt-precorrin-8 methylmutase